MGALVSAVWVLPESGSGEKVAFGPADTEIPAWALEQMGDHCFVDGQRPDASGDTQGSYKGWKKAELEAEVDKRNEDREGDDLIEVDGKGTVADLVAALEADDAASQS